MKRLIYLTAIILSLGFLITCSDSGSGDVDTGFIELDFDTSYTWGTNKYYTDLAGQNCNPSNDCICIYIDEEINGVSYTGFAVRDANNDFNIKIYSSDGGTTYTVILKDGSNTVSCSGIAAGYIFNTGPTITSGFASADFTANPICSSAYKYSAGIGTDDIAAPVY